MAAMLIAARQALTLRQRVGALPLPEALAAFLGQLSDHIALVDEDRALDVDLRRLIQGIHDGVWEPYLE
jgi:histidine ammonia-lyase